MIGEKTSMSLHKRIPKYSMLMHFLGFITNNHFMRKYFITKMYQI